MKQHQEALIHFKKELSRHLTKLQQLANEGNPPAAKRVKEVRTKLLQVNKILPYLNKYIAVNRQAELQTVAVLKERCNVELLELQKGGSRPSSAKKSASSPSKTQASSGSSVSVTPTKRMTDDPTTASTSSTAALRLKAPVDRVVATEASPTVSVPTETSAPLSATSMATIESHVGSVGVPNLEESPAQSGVPVLSPNPPGAIAAEAPAVPPTPMLEDNQYAALSSIRPRNAPTPVTVSSSRGNYANLELLPCTTATAPQLAPTVNYVRVSFDPVKGTPVIVTEPSAPAQRNSAVPTPHASKPATTGAQNATSSLPAPPSRPHPTPSPPPPSVPAPPPPPTVPAPPPPPSAVGPTPTHQSGTASASYNMTDSTPSDPSSSSVLAALSQLETASSEVLEDYSSLKTHHSDRMKSPPAPPVAKKPARRLSAHQRSGSDTADSSLQNTSHNAALVDPCNDSKDELPLNRSPIREVVLRSSRGNTPQGHERSSSGSSTKDVLQVTEGVPSVLERIQVCSSHFLQ